MNLNLASDIFNNLKDNKFLQSFIKELANYMENNLTNKSNLITSNTKSVDLNEDNLTINNRKISTKFRDKMLTERAEILQNYASSTSQNGEMYYIYGQSENRDNSYNLTICDSTRSHEVITISKDELPAGASIGSVLEKQEEGFWLDNEATDNIASEINEMIKEKIEEQEEYLESKRIEGHTYEVGEKYLGRVFLYDLNDLEEGTEGIEETEFPKELYNTAKEGDEFIYINGEYQQKN